LSTGWNLAKTFKCRKWLKLWGNTEKYKVWGYRKSNLPQSHNAIVIKIMPIRIYRSLKNYLFY
jgi:hypothetical protein